jgi:autophagy-related protein 13
MGGAGGENRKRYSSSFGHRYKDSAGGASEVSTGSAERRERESDKGGGVSISHWHPVRCFLMFCGSL